MKAAVAIALLLPTAAFASPAEDLDAPFGVVREPAVSISPRFSPMAGAAGNDDVLAGVSLTIQPLSFIGFEAHFAGFPRGGAANTSSTTQATLQLIDEGAFLETVDRAFLFTAGALFVPVSGHLAPPGLPGAHLEMLLGVGAGLEVVQLENLRRTGDTFELVTDPVTHPRGVFDVLVGMRLLPVPEVGFRFDARVATGLDSVLDHRSEESAIINRSLPEGRTANRTLCAADDTEARCRVEGFASLTLELAVEFTFGARAGSAQ